MCMNYLIKMQLKWIKLSHTFKAYKHEGCLVINCGSATGSWSQSCPSPTPSFALMDVSVSFAPYTQFSPRQTTEAYVIETLVSIHAPIVLLGFNLGF
jgi:hypothetical protein